MQLVKSEKNINFIKLSDLVVINPENISPNINEINYVDISSVKDGFLKKSSFIQGKDNFPSRAKRKVIKGDILYSTVRPNLNGYARIKSDNITASTGFAVIRGKTDADTALTYYYLTSNPIKHKIMGICQGGNYPAFKAKELYDFDIPFFEKSEKEKIANFLSNRESYLESIHTLISKMEQRNQYYLNKTLEIISDTNNGENKHNLYELVSFIKGSAFKKSDMYDVGDYPIIKMNNFKDGKVIISNRTLYTDIIAKNSKLEKGDLLIGMSGSVGASAVFDLDAESYLNQRIIALRLKEDNFKKVVHNIMPHYIKNIIQKEINGGAIKNVSYKHIESLVFYANTEDLFKKADELSNLENELDLFKQLYSKEKQVFQWLCEKLVSGEYKIED